MLGSYYSFKWLQGPICTQFQETMQPLNYMIFTVQARLLLQQILLALQFGPLITLFFENMIFIFSCRGTHSKAWQEIWCFDPHVYEKEASDYHDFLSVSQLCNPLLEENNAWHKTHKKMKLILDLFVLLPINPGFRRAWHKFLPILQACVRLWCQSMCVCVTKNNENA